MIILTAFAFLAGIVTILSPCILPILPVVLSGSLTGTKRRPLGVVFGFVLSFTFFTLFLATIVKNTGLSANVLRNFSVIIILAFGISLLIPKVQIFIEQMFVRLARFTPKERKEGFLGGMIVGVSIGLVWTPCVGPILASVISLALVGTVTSQAVIITLAYSLGTAIPMLAIVYGGRELLNRVPWLVRSTADIQKIFGLLMIVTAIGIYFNYDKKFQTYILDKFPGYGAGLTQLEEADIVDKELENLQSEEKVNQKNLGRPMSDMLEENLSLAPELIPGGEWFNLPEGKKSLTLQESRGKVVLVDFWTYTCINCIRTLPYLKSWHAKYKDEGLVIIGVHTPEFEFEKSPENVAKAIKDYGLEYTVMQDNNYDTWNAYNNRYWPAKYLIDKDGKIRYTHFGEGEYDQTEEMIQTLLKELGSEVNASIENPTYNVQSKTPETYLGYGRMAYFATPSQLKPDVVSEYSFPKTLAFNQFAYDGNWLIEEERSIPSVGARLYLGFEAKNVFLVMRERDGIGKVRVVLDDKVVGEKTAGDDVSDGIVEVEENRLYNLIKLDSAGKHSLLLEFLDDNVEVYAFTFG
jgi:cytochrome c biogenesis protein CcdA/thiol-disulfide isomerase/thioredoxin